MFPFENKFDTMDRFPKIQGQKIVETTVRFSILENKFKTVDITSKM